MKFLGCTHRVKARRSSHIIAARRSLAAQQPQGVGLAHHRVLFNHLFLSVGGQASTRGGYGIFHAAQELRTVGAGGLGGQSPQKDESRCH